MDLKLQNNVQNGLALLLHCLQQRPTCYSSKLFIALLLLSGWWCAVFLERESPCLQCREGFSSL